jgi:hypothetical protein
VRAGFARPAAALALVLAGPTTAWAKHPAPAAKVAKRPSAGKKAPVRAPAQSRARNPPEERATPAALAGGETSGDGAGSGDDGTPGPSAGAGPATKIKTKSYSFGAMDVEGKLKTPQLLYFLDRVKLELDMSAPDKRSFMKELEQSADDKNL